MSPTLKQFLTEWYNWTLAGAEDHLTFSQDMALCDSLYEWLSEKDEDLGSRMELAEALGSNPYPFGGMDAFVLEGENYTAHLNERRLAWVKTQLGIV